MHRFNNKHSNNSNSLQEEGTIDDDITHCHLLKFLNRPTYNNKGISEEEIFHKIGHFKRIDFIFIAVIYSTYYIQG